MTYMFLVFTKIFRVYKSPLTLCAGNTEFFTSRISILEVTQLPMKAPGKVFTSIARWQYSRQDPNHRAGYCLSTPVPAC